MCDTEIFKPIYLFGMKTNYSVSNTGKVFNNKYKRMLKNKIDSKGYYVVSICIPGHIIDQRVHRLVATAFIPNPNDFPIVNHLDGDKLNPNVENLEWTTAKGNAEHASKTGLLHPAKLENHGKAILSNQQVAEICELMESGQVTQKEIANIYNVNEFVIREIRLGNNWTDISKNYDVVNCKMIANKPITDDKVIKICELLIENENTINEIANLMDVTPFVVLSIFNHKKHKHIADKYDFSNYNKYKRYDKKLINKIRNMMIDGYGNSDIVDTFKLERGPKTNTFLCRQRKIVEHQNGKGGF